MNKETGKTLMTVGLTIWITFLFLFFIVNINIHYVIATLMNLGGGGLAII